MQKHALAFAVLATLAAGQLTPAVAQTNTSSPLTDLSQIKTVVVIYAENRSFDHLWGTFPGANGLANATPAQMTQIDRDGKTAMATLPPITGEGLTDPSDPTQIPTEATKGHPNQPFALDDPAGYNVNFNYKLHDLVHRFYNDQMQIDGGKNDKYATWSDVGGEVMGHYNNGSQMALWPIAQQYVLADNFFQGAFGGSFLNHQYLICACAPYDYKTAIDPVTYKGNISAVAADGVSLQIDPKSPTSAIDGPPVYVNDNVLTPDYYGVNTMQPPYMPSANAGTGADPLIADQSKANTLSPQGATTIGDLLTAANVTWAWYAGAWQAQLDGTAPATAQFQFHHQPFNYYQNLAPHTAARPLHLLDGGINGSVFISAIDAGQLPAVTFYKPQGSQNQHAGYATVNDGDAHIADVISHLQKSPQWNNMLVVVTYDENGGWWDHVAPPKGDRWGPGTRIPAIIISKFAKRGFVDHTQYDTASILRFITRRFSLPELPGIQARDNALIAAGGKPMGDLTAALDMSLNVDSGFTGLWYNKDQSGHGFEFEVLGGGMITATWYVFDSTGKQAWLGGIGTITGNKATLAMLQPTGGLFPPNFNPSAITNLNWGTLNVTFSDCGSAHADWTTTAAGFSGGSLDLIRLTQPVASASCH